MVRLNRLVGAVGVALVMGIVSVSPVTAQQECQCASNASGRIGGVLGGGLFAGLVAAVLHFAHASAPALAPSVVPMRPPDPVEPLVVASAPGALAPEQAQPGPATPAAAPAPSRTLARRPISPREAREEGLVPPKTATIVPALAMIGVGSLLLGLFLLRERKRRSWW